MIETRELEIQTVLEKLDAYSQVMATAQQDSTEFSKAANATTDLLHPTINIRDLAFISTQVGRPLTNAELAKLIVAARHDEDLSEVLDIGEDARIAYKFKHARLAENLTQQEVAARSKNYTQSQIAKAELGQLSLSPSRWQSLFKTLGKTAHFVIT